MFIRFILSHRRHPEGGGIALSIRCLSQLLNFRIEGAFEYFYAFFTR